jgi:hypothetical protein
MVLLIQKIPGLGISQSSGDGGATVPHIEGIKGAFGTFGIAADPPGGTEPGEAILAIRKDFIGIGLMPHIKEHLIFSEVEGPEEAHDKLHSSQRRGEMPPVMHHRMDDGLSNILTEQGENSRSKALHILRGMYRIQNRHGDLLN